MSIMYCQGIPAQALKYRTRGSCHTHLSLRERVSLPGCPARQLLSPDMSERQCRGDAFPGLHTTSISALADSAPSVQAVSAYSPACACKSKLNPCRCHPILITRSITRQKNLMKGGTQMM